jgi:hypothetical protein
MDEEQAKAWEALPACATMAETEPAYTLPLPAAINGVEVRTLGDTGANVSLVDARLVEELSLVVQPVRFRMAAAAGQSFTVEGAAHVTVTLGGVDVPVRLHVVRGLGHDVILGTDYFSHSGVGSEWKWSGDGSVSLTLDGGATVTTTTTPVSSYVGGDVAVISLPPSASHACRLLVLEGSFAGARTPEQELLDAVCAAAAVPDLRARNPAIANAPEDDRADDSQAWTRVTVDPTLPRRVQEAVRRTLREHWRRFTLRNVPPILKGVCHRITLREGADPASAVNGARRFSPAKLEAIKAMVEELHATDRLVEMPSLTQAVPVVVAKKDDAGKVKGYRVALDFRKLNALSLQEVYPMPRIDDLTAELARHPLRSKLDAKSAFFAIPLDEESVKLTGTLFGPGMQYCWRVAPFGLAGLPQCLQRAVDKAFGTLERVFAYMDDILVGHRSPADIAGDLGRVLRAADELGLCFNPEKCCIGFEELQVLGFDVAFDSVKPARKRTLVLEQWPMPRTPRALRSFLAMARHYLAHLPDFVAAAQPLETLARSLPPGKALLSAWCSEHTALFNEIKASFASAVSLAPLGNGRLRMTTDFSSHAFGYVLEEEREEGWRIVAAGSHATNRYEARYGPMDGEIAALRFAIRKCQHMGLEGRPIEWRCDNRPATQSFVTNHRSNDRIRRTAVELSPFTITPVWVEGKSMAADALSRLEDFVPRDELAPGPDDQEGAGDGFWQVQAAVATRASGERKRKLQEAEDGEAPALPTSVEPAAETASPPAAAPPEPEQPGASVESALKSGRQPGAFELAAEERVAWIRDQKADPDLRHADRLGASEDEHGVLRKENGAILVPAAQRAKVVTSLHDNALHQGAAAMLRAAAGWVWWPGMRKELQEAATICPACQHTKQVRDDGQRGDMAHNRERFREWHLDTAFVPEASGDGKLAVLTAMEDATGFLVHEVVATQEPQEALAAFTDRVWHPSGRRVKVVRLDQGTEFLGVMRKGLEAMGIEVRETPVGDNNAVGRLERSHKTLKDALRRRALAHPGTSVRDHLADVTAAMNAMCGAGQTISPWEAMYGEAPQPVPSLSWLVVARTLTGATQDDLAWQAAVAADGATRAMAQVRDEASVRRHGDPEAKQSRFVVGDAVRHIPHNGASLQSGAIAFGPYWVTKVHPGDRAVDLVPADVPWEKVRDSLDSGNPKPTDGQQRVTVRSLAQWHGPVDKEDVLLPKAAVRARRKVENDERAAEQEADKRRQESRKRAARDEQVRAEQSVRDEVAKQRARAADIRKMSKRDREMHAEELEKIQDSIERDRRRKQRRKNQ